ncbi:MAG: ATP-binding cassette domain-containing protein [Paracoccaceae bacterium]
MSARAGLVLDRLRVALGAERLVDLDLGVAPGEVLTVMGPSGTGKSTLLAAITGTLAPAFRMSGRVRLDGEDVTDRPTHRRGIGLLMQDDVLFPHLSVGANLAFGLTARVRGRRARAEAVDAALTAAGLEGYGPRDPATLSGGQRARVALMRALLAEPRALLLDEPFSKLDADRRARIRTFTFTQTRAHGLPVLLVTHDAEDAAEAGGRVVAPDGRTPGPERREGAL